MVFNLRLQIVQLPGLSYQLLAELRVGYVDQLLGALPDGFSIKIGDSIFCHHVPNVVARGDDARSGF
jgi:hypothetical protein